MLKRDYWTAIRAASASPSSSARAANLGFVVKCAIEDGLYDFAATAADKVPRTSDRDRLKINVIEARRRTTSTVEPVDGDRESMACLSLIPMPRGTFAPRSRGKTSCKISADSHRLVEGTLLLFRSLALEDQGDLVEDEVVAMFSKAVLVSWWFTEEEPQTSCSVDDL